MGAGVFLVREVSGHLRTKERADLSGRHAAATRTMKMRIFNHDVLVALNESSIQAGRHQNLRSEQMKPSTVDRYWVNEEHARERDGQPEIRMCVVLDLFTGQTAWLDVSPDEFEAIPKVELSFEEWETAMCAGSPPTPS